MGVHTYPMPSRGVKIRDPSRTGSEIIERILGIDPAFDRMHAWKIMLTRNWNTGGYLDLFFDQIVIDHFFSHRMFYLDAGVHFNEIEFLVFVTQEFNGSADFVIHRPCSCDSGFPHFFPELRGRSEEHTSELQS